MGQDSPRRISRSNCGRYLTGQMPFCRPTNSGKALKAFKDFSGSTQLCIIHGTKTVQVTLLKTLASFL